MGPVDMRQGEASELPFRERRMVPFIETLPPSQLDARQTAARRAA